MVVEYFLINALAVFVLVTIYVAATSVWIVPADKYLVSFFLRDYSKVYAPQDYLKQQPRMDWKGATSGWFGSNVVILLYPLWEGIYFPTTTIVLQYHAARIYTKDGVPIFVSCTLIIQLDPKLDNFVRVFNVFGKGYDLAREERISYRIDRDQETGEIKEAKYDKPTPCIAGTMLASTQDLLLETIRRTASTMTWKDISGNIPKFEHRIRYALADPNSAFARAEILVRQPGDDENAYEGPAAQRNGVDITIPDVTPMDKDFLNSLAIPEIEKRKGEGEANRINAIREQVVKPGGREVFRNETLRAIDSVDIFATNESANAIIGRLLQGSKDKKTKKKGEKE
ncbi:MAG: hypothetical protein WEC84_00770 [Candidatus Andersenbacteria bacterium]